MSTLWQDLRYAARLLWNSPGFTLVAVVALALGIGATTAIYTAVDQVLLRPLPFFAPARLIKAKSFQGNSDMDAASVPDARDLAARANTLEGLAYYRKGSVVLTGRDPLRVDASIGSANLFSVLGTSPVLGRAFAQGEDEPGRSRVVVLSYGLWQRRFGGDRGLVGRTVEIDSQPFTVIGVAPPGFHWPIEDNDKRHAAELWLPLPHDANDVQAMTQRGSHMLRLVGRLRPGVSVGAANADLRTVAAQLRHEHPDDDRDLDVKVEGLHEALTASVRPTLWTLLVAVGCVLFIACANVAGLLLARATVRQREVAIRTALGASRARLVRQMLTESLLLALIGGAVGVLVALWLVDLLGALAAGSLPPAIVLHLDARILAITTVVAAATGLLFGLVPALHAAGGELNESLKETARGSAHGRSRRARNALLVGEMILTVVLLAGAGLALRSFARLQKVDPGFSPRGLAIARFNLPSSRYPDDKSMFGYYTRLKERLQTIPGAESVALGGPMPFTYSDISTGVHRPGRPQTYNMTLFHAVSPSYFHTLQIPLRSGRLFTAAEDQPGANSVIVVNERFVQHNFPGENPLGKHIEVNDRDCQIIGVVGDVHHGSLARPTYPEAYVTFGRLSQPWIAVAVRGPAPQALLAEVRRAMLDVDADLPPTLLATMDTLMGEAIAGPRFTLVLLGLFAALALALATIGVYGVTSYTVSQRTREIGIRRALGASDSAVLQLVLGESLRLGLWAVGIGLGLSLALGRLAHGLLYGVAGIDPLLLALVSLVLVGTCLAAALLPARRATRVDPIEALRYE